MIPIVGNTRSYSKSSNPSNAIVYTKFVDRAWFRHQTALEHNNKVFWTQNKNIWYSVDLIAIFLTKLDGGLGLILVAQQVITLTSIISCLGNVYGRSPTKNNTPTKNPETLKTKIWSKWFERYYHKMVWNYRLMFVNCTIRPKLILSPLRSVWCKNDVHILSGHRALSTNNLQLQMANMQGINNFFLWIAHNGWCCKRC